MNVAFGVALGAAAGLTLYAINVASSGQEFDAGDAFTAAGVGALAGGLISCGLVAAGAGVLSAGASAVTVSTGVGIATSAGGYMVANSLTGDGFDSTDFAIASAVGAGSGAIGQAWATTPLRMMGLNAGANVLQYEANSIAAGNGIVFDEGVFGAFVTGAVSGAIAGPYTEIDNLTRNRVVIGSNGWGGNRYGYGLGLDDFRYPNAVQDGIARSVGGSLFRGISAAVVSNLFPLHETR